MTARPALFSIHDVMPRTLQQVGGLVELCRQHGVDSPTLLVVPGGPWQPADLQQLRQWEASGCELAGHGWDHRCRTIRGLKHRLHSMILSRDVAEHLALRGDEIIALMIRCGQWFHDQALAAPTLYVPPAWALGAVTQTQLSAVPFRLVETLSGIRATRDAWRRNLPLVGFEADNTFRQWSLSIVNRVMRFCTSERRPLRVGIHPADRELRMADDLLRTLRLPWEPVSYASLLQSEVPTGPGVAV